MRRPILLLLLLASAVPAAAAPLTADEAVRIALQHNSQIVQARAGQLTARSGLWGAYSQVLPSVSASGTRSGNQVGEQTVTGLVQDPVSGQFTLGRSRTYDRRTFGTSAGLSGSWSVLDPAAIVGLSAARQGVRAANYSLGSARSDVVFATKQQFYTVVQAMHQAVVNAQALHVARDSERRVRAMYEVGSVSKSDLLNAQVTTSQAQLDSLTAATDVTQQRILLAQQMGVPENQVGEVDSSFTATAQPVDVPSVLADARSHRPDLLGAEASARSAELELRAAHWQRLPFLSLNGSWTPHSTSYSAGSLNPDGSDAYSQNSESRRAFSGNASVNLPIFDGLATDSRVASARARVLTARETRDALLRNLEGEVHRAVLGYQEALERIEVGTRTVASAAENQNLVQQKYNVGSATILDLINSQVQLQRAQSSLVAAQAALRIAEARLDQVRGLTP